MFNLREGMAEKWLVEKLRVYIVVYTYVYMPTTPMGKGIAVLVTKMLTVNNY